MRRTRLNPMSAKRRAEAGDRAAVIAMVAARDGAHCKAKLLVPEVSCWGPLDPDEFDQRGQRPGGHLDPANVQLLCRLCHTFKTQEPKYAAILGLRDTDHLFNRWLPPTGPSERDVLDALRALATFKAGAVPGARVPEDAALARHVPDALRAIQERWDRWACGISDGPWLEPIHDD